MRSRHVQVVVNLDTIRESAERIRRKTGVALIAVIKADAYGLGAERAADALASVVDDFAYFSVYEAREVGRPGIVLGPPEGELSWYQELGLRPSIGNRAAAERFGSIRCALSLDTGMQRFGCSAVEAEELMRGGRCEFVEAMTHSTRPGGAAMLREFCGGRIGMLHAAASSMLENAETWLDAVRPGVALYRGAMRVTTRLESVRDCHGPVGYTGFEAARVGVILAGYSHGVSRGPAVINGRRQQILEVGMNSSFVSADSRDRENDEVVMLGDGLTEDELGAQFGTRPHEVLCRYGAMGVREWASSRIPATIVEY